VPDHEFAKCGPVSFPFPIHNVLSRWCHGFEVMVT
jgi:hypothetical protein